MDMGMNVELLTPGVQHTEEADLCTEVSRIASDFQKCFRTGTEQEIVEDLFEDSREGPGVLEEVVPRRRLGGAVGQGAFYGQPRDEVLGIDDGGGGKARPCSHMELHPAPSSI
jgi:hypothetical protein